MSAIPPKDIYGIRIHFGPERLRALCFRRKLCRETSHWKQCEAEPVLYVNFREEMLLVVYNAMQNLTTFLKTLSPYRCLYNIQWQPWVQNVILVEKFRFIKYKLYYGEEFTKTWQPFLDYAPMKAKTQQWKARMYTHLNRVMSPMVKGKVT